MEKFTSVDLGPRQLKEAQKALSGMSWESKGFIEKTNKLENGEVKESESALYNLFGAAPGADAYRNEYQKLFDRFSGKISKANLEEFVVEAAAAQDKIKAARPVVDKRETREALEERERVYQQHQEEERKKRAEFDSKAVEIPAGKMGIYLVECFDDSDMMTDYFNPHRPVTEHVLAIVKNQAQKEALARRVIEQIPDLAALEWSWHTENYSMGHGNYLQAKSSHRKSKEQAYRDRGHDSEVPIFYEIQFWKTYGSPRKALPHPIYFLGDLIEHRPATPGAGNGNGKEIRENNEKGGVEIVFSEKPDDFTLSRLKAHGWRWSRFNALWYNKLTPENLEFARTL